MVVLKLPLLLIFQALKRLGHQVAIVGLLNALNAFKGLSISTANLAEKACEIEP